MFLKTAPLNYPFKRWLLLLLVLLVLNKNFAQNGVAINTTGASANSSAMLDVTSTTAGVLIPRMTSAQRVAVPVSSTRDGLLVYQTDAPIGFYYYNASTSSWTLLSTSSGTVTSVTASSPLSSSLGITPNISLSGVVPITSGGTNGTATPTNGGIAYGTGTTYAFSVAGTNGQVLTSGGSGTPTWTSQNSLTLGQSCNSVFGNASLSNFSTTSFTQIPNLSATVNVPSNCKILINTDGGIQTNSTSSTGYSIIDIAIFIDGVLLSDGGYQRITALNNGIVKNFGFWSQALSTSLTSGLHTVAIKAAFNTGTATATVGGDNTTVLQPELTVTIIKQ